MKRRLELGLLLGVEAVTAYESPGGRVLGRFADLDAALAAGPKGGAVAVLLSDAHCRYAVLERPPGLRNVAELRAAAQGRMRAMFGGLEGWPTRLNAAPAARRDLGIAVDPAVLAQLQDAASRAGVTLRSVRSHWLAWAEHCWPQLRRGAHWLVSHDGEWAAVGYLEHGACVQLRSVHCPAGAAELETLLAREQAFCDAEPQASIWLGGVAEDGERRSSGRVCMAARRLWGAA